MGCVFSNHVSPAEYQIRQFRMLHRTCGGLKPQYKAMMLIPPEVRYKVERWSMRRDRPIRELYKYLDESDLNKPKQAKTIAQPGREPHDVLDHPEFDCRTGDFNQFFYDCQWYEYMLRKLNLTEPYQYRHLDPTKPLSEEQTNLKRPTRARTEPVCGEFDILDHPDFDPLTMDFTQRHYDEEYEEIQIIKAQNARSFTKQFQLNMCNCNCLLDIFKI